jgi:hypothetical protein
MLRQLLVNLDKYAVQWLYVTAFPFVALVVIPCLALKMMFTAGNTLRMVARPGGMDQLK